MNWEHGMGLPVKKPKLRVFLPFFIQAVLPHHIMRGEILTLDFIIFNYLSKSQSVTVTVLRNDAQYEALQPKLNGWKGEIKLLHKTLQFFLNIIS